MKGVTSLMFLACLLAFLSANATDSPSCKVSAEVREVGRIGSPLADTMITLQSNQIVQLALNITNKGQEKDFIVKMKTFGLVLLDGPLSRNVSVTSLTDPILLVGLRGADLKSPCDPGSRRLAYTVYAKSQPERVCGTAMVNFLCVEGEARQIVAQFQPSNPTDTQVVAKRASSSVLVQTPPLRVVSKDTLIHAGKVQP